MPLFLGSSWLPLSQRLWGGAASWLLEETELVTAGDELLLQHLRETSREFPGSLEGQDTALWSCVGLSITLTQHGGRIVVRATAYVPKTGLSLSEEGCGGIPLLFLVSMQIHFPLSHMAAKPALPRRAPQAASVALAKIPAPASFWAAEKEVFAHAGSSMMPHHGFNVPA